MSIVHHALPQIESELAEANRAAVECDLAQRIADHQNYDAHHCSECGEPAMGCVMGGGHVQLCDECIIAYVMTHITPGINVAALA
jgi:hypothetical protein